MTAHLDGRLNSLGSAPEDVETRLSAIASAFGLDWLQNGGDHPLQGLWRRRDALATCQLAWFGDAICGMRQIDEKWTRRELAKIRNEPANNRKGAAFELLGLNIFAQRKKHRIVPSIGHKPGYDGTIHFAGGGRLAMSIKNYGASVHEKDARSEGARLEAAFVGELRMLDLNGLELRAIARTHPTPADWRRLAAALPSILSAPGGLPASDEVWTAFVQPLPDFEARTSPSLSYQITVLARMHPNERQNLISKLDEAYANAHRHAATDTDLSRAVLIHLPENASVASCEKWANDYFIDRPDGMIDLIVFYQPAVVATPDGQGGIVHHMSYVVGPRYVAWSKPDGGPRRQLEGGFYVGSTSPEPARLSLQSADGDAIATDEFYVFQSGSLYVGFDESQDGTYDVVAGNPAPGILKRPAIFDRRGIRGLDLDELFARYFPPTNELVILT